MESVTGDVDVGHKENRSRSEGEIGAPGERSDFLDERTMSPRRKHCDKEKLRGTDKGGGGSADCWPSAGHSAAERAG